MEIPRADVEQLLLLAEYDTANWMPDGPEEEEAKESLEGFLASVSRRLADCPNTQSTP